MTVLDERYRALRRQSLATRRKMLEEIVPLFLPSNEQLRGELTNYRYSTGAFSTAPGEEPSIDEFDRWEY